jgi:hypothetical protein
MTQLANQSILSYIGERASRGRLSARPGAGVVRQRSLEFAAEA